MTRKITLMIVALLAMVTPAFAVTQGSMVDFYQELHFRTGPGTDFADFCAVPVGADVTAIEMEEGDGVTWMLCDYEYRGNRARGYTDLENLELIEPVLWSSNYELSRTLINDSDVYAAPDDTSLVRASLRAGDVVTFLNFEGSFCFVEYQQGGARERGYIHEYAFWVDLGEFSEWFPDNEYYNMYVVRPSANVYGTFLGNQPPEYSIPYDRSVIMGLTSNLPDDWIDVYYAGKWWFGHRGDFNDLRGFIELDY